MLALTLITGSIKTISKPNTKSPVLVGGESKIMIDINTKVHFRSDDGREHEGIICGYENDLYKINCVGAGIWETYKVWLVAESMIDHICVGIQ